MTNLRQHHALHIGSAEHGRLLSQALAGTPCYLNPTDFGTASHLAYNPPTQALRTTCDRRVIRSRLHLWRVPPAYIAHQHLPQFANGNGELTAIKWWEQNAADYVRNQAALEESREDGGRRSHRPCLRRQGCRAWLCRNAAQSQILTWGGSGQGVSSILYGENFGGCLGRDIFSRWPRRPPTKLRACGVRRRRSRLCCRRAAWRACIRLASQSL